MTKPYLLVSDIHAHNWSAFATTDATGMNSRLRVILDELERAAAELLKRGGKEMRIAGDLFHVRGQIDPEVFNPVHATMTRIIAKGIEIDAIPGNHDLKGKETNELGNAIQTLSAIPGFHVHTKPTVLPPSLKKGVIMVPWCAVDTLREGVKTMAHKEERDLIIHAGIDGVLDSVPNAGLSAAEVASWGFNRVFAGHYHNHKVMEGGKVISIGATTHQTWSDIGTKAGFIFVYDDHIEWQASHAPEFVEITGDDDPAEIPLIVDGNYVRIRSMRLSDSEINSFRAQLQEMGARGVSFQVTRETVSARTGSTVGKAATLDESVDKFIDTMSDIESVAPNVKRECADVLNHVRGIAA